MNPIRINLEIPDLVVSIKEETWGTKENGVTFALQGLKQDPIKYAAIAESILKKEAGEKGDSEANLLLGMLYLQGLGCVPKDIDLALHYLQMSRQSQAQYLLGVIYLKGKYGVPEDRERGLKYLQAAGEREHHAANALLGALYWIGAEGQCKDRAKATTYFYSSWRSFPYRQIPQEVANYFAGYIASSHLHDVDKWIERADPALHSALYDQQGDRQWKELTYNLKKNGSVSDDITPKVKAIVAWDKAAKLIAIPHAQNEKALLCKLGHSIYHFGQNGRALLNGSFEKSDYAIAISYWQRAAEADYPMAQYYLGLAICSGKGVPKDTAKGNEWLQKAAKQQFLPATAMLNHLEGKEKMKKSSKPLIEDPLRLPPKEENDCIAAQHKFLGKAWTWIQNHSKAILISTISAVAIAVLVAGVVALTIFFPPVMIPILVVAGVIGAALVVLGIGFAAGSGDRSAQRALKWLK